MDRTVELFASTYPKNSNLKSNMSMRTPLENVMGIREEFMKREVKMSDSSKQGVKKFFVILLIVFVGAFLYSSFAYTGTDFIFSKFGMEFFTETGQPSVAIIVIHSLIFLGLIYIILSQLKWWK